MFHYYDQTQFIAQGDRKDFLIGKVEKWEAHKKGILHRGFTCILSYRNKIILQHRRHPAFDGVFDLTFSSHQLYEGSVLQDDLTAIYQSLKREWNVRQKDLVSKPEFLGKFYYKAKDPNSIYTEHEIDYIYETHLKNVPNPNYDFAYGFSLVDKRDFLTSSVFRLSSQIFAPWVKKIIGEKMI